MGNSDLDIAEKCDCGRIINYKEFAEHNGICPKCGYDFLYSPKESKPMSLTETSAKFAQINRESMAISDQAKKFVDKIEEYLNFHQFHQKFFINIGNFTDGMEEEAARVIYWARPKDEHYWRVHIMDLFRDETKEYSLFAYCSKAKRIQAIPHLPRFFAKAQELMQELVNDVEKARKPMQEMMGQLNAIELPPLEEI